MSYRIVPRTEIGLPAVVTSSTGTPRPPLANEPWITAHYTGVNTVYSGRDVPAQILHIQRIFSSTKPFEYNYVIGQTDDNLVYEFAGKFRAAHSGGENSDSFGVLFLNGVSEPITDVQQDKWRWLRDVLIADGSLRTDVMQRKHKEMPGAATACPGSLMDAVWGDMLQPYHPQVEPELPDTEEGTMKLIRFESAPGVYAQHAAFKTWIPDPATLNVYKFLTKQDVEVISAKHPEWMRASGPIVGPIPAGVDGWGVPK